MPKFLAHLKLRLNRLNNSDSNNKQILWSKFRYLYISIIFVFAAVGSYLFIFSHAATTLTADFNSDSVVNVTDLSILATNWGRTTATHAQGDANSDGTIN
ncbi:MAG TPA: hypothetical protein VMR51_02460, partial [Patescibacteria group bacterium]|nr:hypothetical protein [Patescibacteria group bacterium]